MIDQISVTSLSLHVINTCLQIYVSVLHVLRNGQNEVFSYVYLSHNEVFGLLLIWLISSFAKVNNMK